MVIVCRTAPLPHSRAPPWCACRVHANTSVPPGDKNCSDHPASATSPACYTACSARTASPAASPGTRGCHTCAVAAAAHTTRQQRAPRQSPPHAASYITHCGPDTAAPAPLRCCLPTTRAGEGCQCPMRSAARLASPVRCPTGRSMCLCGLLMGGRIQTAHAARKRQHTRR